MSPIPPSRDPLSEEWSFAEAEKDYKELCKQLWPNVQHDKTLIRVMAVSVNRCLAVDVTDANGKEHRFVLRYPIKLDAFKRTDKDHCLVLRRQVCILQWLETNAPGAKAPKVYSFDETKDNAIHTPYMIMYRCAGQPLKECLLDLTQQQRLDLADALGHWFEDNRDVTWPRAGLVNASGEDAHLNNDDPLIAIWPLGMPATDEMCSALAQVTTASMRVPPIDEDADLDPLEMLNNAFSRRLANDLHRQHPEDLDCQALDICRGIVHKLAGRGYFDQPDEARRFSLVHTDLFPRNILVDRAQRGRAILGGIVDWDNVLFGPGFVACMPPAWLWAPETYVHGVGDFLGCFGLDDVAPETPALQSVKAAFDASAGYFYTEMAHNKEMAMCRVFMDYVQARDWRAHPLFEKRFDLIRAWFKKEWGGHHDLVWPFEA